MKLKAFIFFLIIIFFLVVMLINNTFAYHYESGSDVLFYKENNKEMSDDIEKYLKKMDKLFIINAKFEDAEILRDNYNYMVNFALSYILSQKEKYQESIKIRDLFSYYDVEYKKRETNQYIPLEILYQVTDNFFGVRDFVIMNDNVNIIDDDISLIEYNSTDFLNVMRKVTVTEKNGYVYADVKYDYGEYVFVFYKKNNVLKLYNIEVL